MWLMRTCIVHSCRALHSPQDACAQTWLRRCACDAGMTTHAAQLTQDGYEVHMQTNHLSHFLLSMLLLPALEQAASLRGSARIVNHSSTSRKQPRPTPLQPESFAQHPIIKKSGLAVGLHRYQQSKLANMLFTSALQVRYACCAVLCPLHVGHEEWLLDMRLQACRAWPTAGAMSTSSTTCTQAVYYLPHQCC